MEAEGGQLVQPFVPIAITPDSKTAYSGDGNAVVPIRTATGAAGKPIKVAEIPHAIAIKP